jgi:hypothetical protein
MEGTVTVKRTRKVAINAKKAKLSAEKSKLKVEAMLELYADAQREAEELKATMDELFADIDKTMFDGRISDVECAGWKASQVSIKTNQKNTTDAHALYDLMVKNDEVDEFWGAVTVSAAKVKKVVTGKEYAAITETVPGKVTGTKLKVSPTKKTVTSK